MGNESSTTTEDDPEIRTERSRGSVYSNYQPPVSSLPNHTYSTSSEKNPATNDKRNYDSQRRSKRKVPEEPVASNHYDWQPSSHQYKQPVSAEPVQQSFSIANKERSTPVLSQKPLPSVVTPQQISLPIQKNSLSISSSSFEKAPIVQLNYVVKSSDDKLIHTYESNNITVMRRTSTESVSNSNKWYDNGYNKNSKPPVVKQL